ncbi:hypothetical protein DYQ05_05155 [Treponema pedis]|nr:hypothetical protein DYQ05_05155 [Treponema pedis]
MLKVSIHYFSVDINRAFEDFSIFFLKIKSLNFSNVQDGKIQLRLDIIIKSVFVNLNRGLF